jgi:hypothetical protein
VPLLLEYQLIWWIITQILLELLFVIWAVYVAWKHSMLPTLSHTLSRWLLASLARCFIIFYWSYHYLWDMSLDTYWRVLAWALLNWFILFILFPSWKRLLRGL